MPHDHASKRLQAESKIASKTKDCPICGKPVTAASKPFCSERCREVDLGHWLTGSYVIPARDNDDETS